MITRVTLWDKRRAIEELNSTFHELKANVRNLHKLDGPQKRLLLRVLELRRRIEVGLVETNHPDGIHFHNHRR